MKFILVLKKIACFNNIALPIKSIAKQKMKFCLDRIKELFKINWKVNSEKLFILLSVGLVL